MEKIENIINLNEWEARKVGALFGNVAQEIRNGALQIHFGNNESLFAKTDEILHFTLEGEKLTPDLADYQTRRKQAKDEILRNLQDIENALPRYPRNDCQAVRESIAKMKSLTEQIRT